MAISRPFAYNTGSTISGTVQVGNLAIGTPDVGFQATGLEWWNGPDEELGYVIGYQVPDDSQPTPISGVTASVQFWRSTALDEASFIEIANYVTGQSFTSGYDASIYLTSNGYWNSWNVITPTPTPTNTATPTLTPTNTATPNVTPTITPTNTTTPTLTPTNTITRTVTPSITPTNTITPSTTPTIQSTFITNTTQLGNNSTVTFNNVAIGGPGLIVVTVNSKGGFILNSATIAGVSGAIVSYYNTDDDSVSAIISASITASITTATIGLVFATTTNAVNIGTYRITNNVSFTSVGYNYTNWMDAGTSRNLTISSIPTSNTKVVITTVTETGITGGFQNISFSSTPSTTRNYFQQAANTPVPFYSAAGGLTRLDAGTTSLTITTSFSAGSSQGSIVSVVFN